MAGVNRAQATPRPLLYAVFVDSREDFDSVSEGRDDQIPTAHTYRWPGLGRQHMPTLILHLAERSL